MTRNIRPAMVGGILLFSALFATVLSAADKVQLALRLKEGQTYKTNFVSDQTIKQTIQGQQLDMKQTMGFIYSFAVQKVDSQGTADCRVVYESVLFKQEGPTGPTEYDSANPPETVPAQAKPFAALVGQGFTMRVGSTGKVTEVKGADAIMDKVLQAVEIPEGAMRDTMREQLKGQFGDDAARAQMEQVLAIYPDKPVGVGDSWTRKIAIATGYPLLMENTYTYRGSKAGVAQVDVSSKLSRNPEGKPMKLGPMTIDFDVTGTQKGQMSIIEATGWVEQCTLEQKFGGTVKMEGAPGATAALSWPIEAESTVKMGTPK
jgi:hypothetical protein